MKYFMLLFETFPWLRDPALIICLMSVGACLRIGVRLGDDVWDGFPVLVKHLKTKFSNRKR